MGGSKESHVESSDSAAIAVFVGVVIEAGAVWEISGIVSGIVSQYRGDGGINAGDLGESVIVGVLEIVVVEVKVIGVDVGVAVEVDAVGELS